MKKLDEKASFALEFCATIFPAAAGVMAAIAAFLPDKKQPEVCMMQMPSGTATLASPTTTTSITTTANTTTSPLTTQTNQNFTSVVYNSTSAMTNMMNITASSTSNSSNESIKKALSILSITLSVLAIVAMVVLIVNKNKESRKKQQQIDDIEGKINRANRRLGGIKNQNTNVTEKVDRLIDSSHDTKEKLSSLKDKYEASDKKADEGRETLITLIKNLQVDKIQEASWVAPTSKHLDKAEDIYVEIHDLLRIDQNKRTKEQDDNINSQIEKLGKKASKVLEHDKIFFNDDSKKCLSAAMPLLALKLSFECELLWQKWEKKNNRKNRDSFDKKAKETLDKMDQYFSAIGKLPAVEQPIYLYKEALLFRSRIDTTIAMKKRQDWRQYKPRLEEALKSFKEYEQLQDKVTMTKSSYDLAAQTCLFLAQVKSFTEEEQESFRKDAIIYLDEGTGQIEHQRAACLIDLGRYRQAKKVLEEDQKRAEEEANYSSIYNPIYWLGNYFQALYGLGDPRAKEYYDRTIKSCEENAAGQTERFKKEFENFMIKVDNKELFNSFTTPVKQVAEQNLDVRRMEEGLDSLTYEVKRKPEEKRRGNQAKELAFLNQKNSDSTLESLSASDDSIGM